MKITLINMSQTALVSIIHSLFSPLPLSLFDIHITNTTYLTNDQEKEEDDPFFSIGAHPKTSILYRPAIPMLPNFPCPSSRYKYFTSAWFKHTLCNLQDKFSQVSSWYRDHSPLNCHSRVGNASIALLQRLMSSVLADILHSTHNGRCSLIKKQLPFKRFFLCMLTCETYKFSIYTHMALCL